MRCVIVGDVHLSDRPPSSRTETYTQDILDKLIWIVEKSNELQVEYLVFLGDMFHLKVPSRNSHKLVQSTAKILEAFQGLVLIVPGNHDLSQDRLESLPSQPLGSLALSPNIELLDRYHSESGIYGVPYLDDFNEFKMMVSVADPTILGERPVLIATHASIFPDGEHPPYPHMNASDVAALEGTVPIAYGHIHDPHGFYQANAVWFCNNGAISRGSLHEETVKRSPKVTLFNSEAEGCPFESIDVPHKPAAEVFRLVEVATQKAAEGRLEDFLDSVGSVSLTSISVEEIVSQARTTDLPPSALNELEEIFAQVMDR